MTAPPIPGEARTGPPADAGALDAATPSATEAPRATPSPDTYPAQSHGARRRGPVPGPVLFARYAYPPNLLGLCGPAEAPALLEGSLAAVEPELRHLARGFEGAYPYLRLIAASNGIADPLDRRVVEAYWIGNALTKRVRPREFQTDVATRFRPRMDVRAWAWLEAGIASGSIPNHVFHVLAIFPRAGMLRSGVGAPILETMDRCRIRAARVVGVAADRLLVAARHLEVADGRLREGPERIENVATWRRGSGPLDGVRHGDVVSVHWDWACDRLERRQAAALAHWTERAITIANATTI